MPKNKTNTNVYAEIMSEFATRAVENTAGVQLLSKNSGNSRIFKDNDVLISFVSDSSVNVDIYLNIEYGFNIPDTVCKVQEQVKNAIEKETCYTVLEVNVSVVSIFSNDDEKIIEIVHDFSDEADNTNDND